MFDNMNHFNLILGGHFCEISPALRRTGSTVDRTEFPRHSNPQGYDTGGETLKVSLMVFLLLFFLTFFC